MTTSSFCSFNLWICIMSYLFRNVCVPAHVYNNTIHSLNKSINHNKWKKRDKIIECFLFPAKYCSSTLTPGQAMTTDFSPSRIVFGSQFTATCTTGYAFFRSSGSGWSVSTTKTATCTFSSSDGQTKWWYDDSTSSLGDCIGNQILCAVYEY